MPPKKMKNGCVCEYQNTRYSFARKKSECAIRQCFIRDVLICELDSLKEIGFVDWEDNREVWLKALYPPLIGASISFAKHDNIHHLGFDLRHKETTFARFPSGLLGNLVVISLKEIKEKHFLIKAYLQIPIAALDFFVRMLMQ